MPSLAVTYPFTSSATGFGANPGAATTMAWTGANGNPAGSLSTALAGSNKTNDNNWSLTTTWTGLGVPSDATVTGISILSIDSRCTAFTGGTACTSGAVTLADGAMTITLAVQRVVSATDPAWVNTPGTGVSGISLPATHSITITVPTHLQTTSGGSGKGVTVLHDNLNFTVAYRRNFADPGTGGMGCGGSAVPALALAPPPGGGVGHGGVATTGGLMVGSTVPVVGLAGPLMVTQGFLITPPTVIGSTVPIEGLTGPLSVTLGFSIVVAVREASGGVRYGGAVLVSPAYAESGVGGERLGGSPVVSHARRELPAGGTRLGGAAVVPAMAYTASPSGGERYGGRVVVSLSPLDIGTGGVRQGGTAQPTATYAEAGIGGRDLGGVATLDPFHDYVKFAAGGVQHGGRDVATVAYAAGAAGGMRQGGSATISAGKVPVAAGGMQHGGAAYRTLFSSGGMRHGGSAEVGHSFSAYPDPFAATARTGGQ